jgi:signal transduction histidine kinase
MRDYIARRVFSASLVIWIGCALPAWPETKRVLLLYDERLDLPGLTVLDADIANTFTANSPDPLEVYREAMDLSRFNSDQYPLFLRDFFRAKYADKKIDVAVAVLGPALDFLLAHGDETFPGASIVFCGVDQKEFRDRPLPPNVRGVLVKREFAPTLDIALRIHPDTTRVAVVSGTSEFDRRLLDQARSEFQPYQERLAFTYLTALPLPRILEEIAQLPPHMVVLYISFFQDSTGAPFVSHDIAQRVSAAANAPVYGFVDQYLGRGIVGGSLYSFSAHGADAARLVLQVLSGSAEAKPSFLAPPANRAIFDWQQMRRWKISESSLPAEREIRFRELTVWDQYWQQIIAICAGFVLQAGLIAWLVNERWRRNRAEIESREAFAELTYMNRRASAGELSASIAHEVGQPLTAITMMAAAALKWLHRATPDVKEIRQCLDAIEKESQRAGEIVRGVRSMFRKDTQLDSVDINRITMLVLDLARFEIHKHNVEVRTQFGELPPLTGDPVQLQQVILNLIMNAIEAMHSTKSRVLQITSGSIAGAVKLSIMDTGTGVDPSNVDRIFNPMFTTKSTGMGMGLSICRTIVEKHDGRIWVEARRGGGTIFYIELPVVSASKQAERAQAVPA